MAVYHRRVAVGHRISGRRAAQIADKGNYRKAILKLLQFDVYAIVDGNKRLFTGSKQGRGAYVFTDARRAYEFLQSEPNADIGCDITVCPFRRVWLGSVGDLFINLTPYGNKDAFLLYQYAQVNWRLGCKERNGRYTLPYGLKPHWGQAEFEPF